MLATDGAEAESIPDVLGHSKSSSEMLEYVHINGLDSAMHRVPGQQSRMQNPGVGCRKLDAKVRTVKREFIALTARMKLLEKNQAVPVSQRRPAVADSEESGAGAQSLPRPPLEVHNTVEHREDRPPSPVGTVELCSPARCEKRSGLTLSS